MCYFAIYFFCCMRQACELSVIRMRPLHGRQKQEKCSSGDINEISLNNYKHLHAKEA